MKLIRNSASDYQTYWTSTIGLKHSRRRPIDKLQKVGQNLMNGPLSRRVCFPAPFAITSSTQRDKLESKYGQAKKYTTHKNRVSEVVI